MSDARFIVGDVRDVLGALEPASVDLVLTSSPFLALRSYLPADHAEKGREIGSEATPGEFIDTLLDVVELCARVLAPHGSLVWELGDTFAGSGGAGGDYGDGGLREGQNAFDGSGRRAGPRGVRQGHEHRDGGHHFGGNGWPLDKSLTLVPELFRFALVYGFNPLTGRETERWRVRNVVRWCRPNPPVGALADKFRPATSELVVACKSRSRYFDLDAVRESFQHPDHNERNLARGGGTQGVKVNHDRGDLGGGNWPSTTGGAPPLDWWEIPTQPVKLSHYATWPERLLVRPILSMCPERVCRTCGKPSERITERSPEYAAARSAIGVFNKRPAGDGVSGSRSTLVRAVGRDCTSAENVTVGWTDCGHDTWRPGRVLDPFGGSGTTAAVALGHGRDCILIDIDSRNADLARERVGMWLTVEHHKRAEAVS